MGSTYELLQIRSVGFAHEPNPKFQTTSFTRHYRGQSPRYRLRHQSKRSSENGNSKFCRNLRRHSRVGGNPDVGRILVSDKKHLTRLSFPKNRCWKCRIRESDLRQKNVAGENRSPRYNVHREAKGRLKTGTTIFAETSAVIPAQAGIQTLAFREHFKAAVISTSGFPPARE